MFDLIFLSHRLLTGKVSTVNTNAYHLHRMTFGTELLVKLAVSFQAGQWTMWKTFDVRPPRFITKDQPVRGTSVEEPQRYG